MATRRQIQAFLQDYPDAFLKCRQYGHNWDAYAAQKQGPRYDVTLDCDRCHSKRRILVDSNGMLVKSPHTNYVDGYLAEGLGRITGQAKGVLRLEGIKRVIAAANQS